MLFIKKYFRSLQHNTATPERTAVIFNLYDGNMYRHAAEIYIASLRDQGSDGLDLAERAYKAWEAAVAFARVTNELQEDAYAVAAESNGAQDEDK